MQKLILRRRVVVLTASLAVIGLAFASPASGAGPRVRDLVSPTHPDPGAWYPDADPAFTWKLAVGPLGACDTPGTALGVAVSGDLAYVADFDGGLRVIDVGDPVTPTLVATSDTPGYARGVAVDGAFAYVADGGAGLQVIDVRDPAAPVLVASCPLPGYANDVVVAGGYAFVADSHEGLQVVDVSDPTTPMPVGSVATYGSAEGVDVAGDHAYVADAYGGLLVVDVADPADPVIVGSHGADLALAVAVAGSRAYVADLDLGLLVVDVGDPSAPVLQGICELPGVHDVAVAGDRAFAAAGPGGLQVVDVGDPSAPFVSAVFSTPDRALGVALDDACAYVAADGAGLQIVGRHAATDVAYSYVLDCLPETVPDEVPESREPRARCTDVDDGTWYFHVRAVGLDRKGRPEGEWGPAAHVRVNVDATGPVTTALPFKTSKGGAVVLSFSVSDDRWGSAYVTIDITRGRHKPVRTVDLGWVRSNVDLHTALDARLPRGCSRFVVHAVDPLGNHESEAGASFVVVR